VKRLSTHMGAAHCDGKSQRFNDIRVFDLAGREKQGFMLLVFVFLVVLLTSASNGLAISSISKSLMTESGMGFKSFMQTKSKL